MESKILENYTIQYGHWMSMDGFKGGCASQYIWIKLLEVENDNLIQ